jgi:CheY-like chemotaxis protein
MNANGNGILLVEDDADIRQTLGELLTEEGYRVTTAANGIEALAALNREEPLPNLILLDLMMPGMDGWQFRVELEKMPRARRVPLVVLSADSQTRDIADGLGAVRSLRKPVGLDELLETVATLCTALSG